MNPSFTGSSRTVRVYSSSCCTSWFCRDNAAPWGESSVAMISDIVSNVVGIIDPLCLDEVIAAAVPDTQVGPDNSLDVAVLRAYVYAAETAQATAERELAKKACRRENAAAVTSSTMKELAENRRQLKISKEIAARYRHDAETMGAVVELHKELYQRMENRVKAAEDSVQRLSSPLARKRETFKAAVTSNTAQSRRLHNLLSASSVANVSGEAQLRRRNEDLQGRVKRLITVTQTLRARDKLEEMDQDTLAMSDSDSSVQKSPSDPKKFGDAKAAVPGAPATLVPSTSQPLPRSEVLSPAFNSDRQGCKSPPLRSQYISKARSKTLSRDASRVSSPIRGDAGASSRAASRADIHSSPTSHPPRSLPALSSDESLATLVLSDDDVEIVDVLPAVLPPSSGSRGNASCSVTGNFHSQSTLSNPYPKIRSHHIQA
ncbi:unnamed protein product [Phytophthora fragariaefolia]|uniref:Unnamed protein product n=1 Tax=Phytophthora fragariaefolia TaxID=1490495 RepID=A0A9W6UAX2_9STRA|nr:unnamed protein product [Phytophthora fragariaefolia]